MTNKKTGIPLFAVNYTLTKDELTQALRLVSGRKSHRTRSIIQTALAVAAIFICVTRIIDEPGNFLYYLLCAVCVTLIAVSWIMPSRIEEKIFNRDVLDKNIRFTLSSDELLFVTEPQSAAYILPLNGTLIYQEDESVIVIYITKDHVTVLPKRCLIPEQLELLYKKLRAGMINADEKTEEKRGSFLNFTPSGENKPSEPETIPQETEDKEDGEEEDLRSKP